MFSKFLKSVFVISLLLGSVGCSSSGNSLSSKTYEKLEPVAEENFKDFFSNTLYQYGDIMTGISNFFAAHASDIDGGKSLIQIDGFEQDFDAYYKWCYQVKNYDLDDVPDTYLAAWSILQDIATYSKDDLDRMCTEKNSELVNSVKQFSTKTTADLNSMRQFIPLPDIHMGEAIVQEGFAKIVMKDVYYDKALYPSNRTAGFMYYESQNANTTYLICNFNFTNLSNTAGYAVEDYVSFKAVYEGGYEYTGWSVTDANGRLDPYPDLRPMLEFSSYYLIEVPVSMQNKNCTITCTMNGIDYNIVF